MAEIYPMGMVTAPQQVAFEPRELVEPEGDQVLIRVRAASICGSDLHVFKGKHPSARLPSAVGHELAGEVLRVGPQAVSRKPGDRVVVEPVVVCGTCFFCQRGAYHLCANISFQYRTGQGAFTPYYTVQERWAHPLPEPLTFDQGALIEPLAVSVHAVRQAAIQPGQSAAIFGAGAIGLLTLQVALAAGAGPVYVVDVHDERLAFARNLGATETFNNRSEQAVERILARTAGLGVDRAFEAVGLEATLLQALSSVRKGGRVVILGIFEEPMASLPANLLVQRELTLAGSHGYNWDFQTALALAAAGRVDLEALITHRLPLEQLSEAFGVLLGPRRDSVKVVLQP